MTAICRADHTKVVCPYDVVLEVTTSRKRAIKCAWKINLGVLPILQQVAVTQFANSIAVITYDCARRAHRGGRAADCAGWVEECVVAFFGNYKTVVSGRGAKNTASRVGTGKSRYFTGGADANQNGASRTRGVNNRVFHPIQNETVADISRAVVVIAADDNSLRADEAGCCEYGAGRINRRKYPFCRQHETMTDGAS